MNDAKLRQQPAVSAFQGPPADAPPPSTPPAPPATASAPAPQLPGCPCADTPPPGGDCRQQRDAGNCYAAWMVAQDLCTTTCGRCACPGQCTCSDVPPDGRFNCAQQAGWGKCNETWMLNNCQQSCGHCTCPAAGTGAPTPAALPPSQPAAAAPTTASTAPAPGSVPGSVAVAIAAPVPSPGPGPLPVVAPGPAATPTPPAGPAQQGALPPPPAAAPPGPPTQQQLLQPLLSQLGGAPPGGAAPPGGTTAGAAQCPPDILVNFLRGSPDLTLYLSLAVLTGFLQRQLADPALSATLLLPSDDAVRAFLQQQGLSAASIYVYAPQLESVLAYHALPQPLSYADLGRAGASGAPLPTDLPGATLKATLLNATALRLEGLYGSANLLRANQLVCRTVVHVIDAVLLPARSIQYVLPYDQAVGGLQAGPPPVLPGQPPGAPGCFPSLADAMAGTPQLSIARTTVGLTGWNLTNPGLNITMFAVSDSAQQLSIAGYLAPDQAQIQQLLGEAARNSRLLHAGVAYLMVVGYGGLNSSELGKAEEIAAAETALEAGRRRNACAHRACSRRGAMLRDGWDKFEGEELPTLFKPHTLFVEPGPEGGVAIAGELTAALNQTAATIMQSIATCGGSGETKNC